MREAEVPSEIASRGGLIHAERESRSEAVRHALQVIENALGRVEGTLLEKVDNCVTSAGRRLLRDWLVRPLKAREDIVRRQDAVASLLEEASDAVGTARKRLSKVPGEGGGRGCPKCQ